MPKFGRSSEVKLAALHPKLVRVLRIAVKLYDFTIIETHRSEETHEKYIKDKKTKVSYSKTKHSHNPSLAVDLAPYPVDWDDKNRFCFVAGAILMAADMLGIGIRWGGDWDGDKDFNDQTFDDLVHFELNE